MSGTSSWIIFLAISLERCTLLKNQSRVLRLQRPARENRVLFLSPRSDEHTAAVARPLSGSVPRHGGVRAYSRRDRSQYAFPPPPRPTRGVSS